MCSPEGSTRCPGNGAIWGGNAQNCDGKLGVQERVALPHETPAWSREGLPWVSPAPSPACAKVAHLGCWLWGTPGCRVPFTQPLQRSFALTPPKVWLQPLEVTADLQLHRQSHLWRGGGEPCSWPWAALPQPAAKPLLAIKTSTRKKICHPQPFPIIPVPCNGCKDPLGTCCLHSSV